MDQLERIEDMEKSYDIVRKAITDFASAMEKYQAALPLLQELKDYYQSEEWMNDYQDDESGMLPSELKRAVLSEDGISSLLEVNVELLADIGQLLECSQIDGI